MKRWLQFAVLGLALAGPTTIRPEAARAAQKASVESGPAAKEIEKVLTLQQDAWNRGDIPGFVEYYWKSSELTFSGANGVTRGWDGLLARYQRSYPDRATMGKLSFSDLETRMLAPDAALVLGRWRLTREKDAPGGVFTLVVRKFPIGWRVIHDHTSDEKR